MPNEAGRGTTANLYVNSGGNVTTIPFTVNLDGSLSVTYPGALPSTPYIWITVRFTWGPMRGTQAINADIEPVTVTATIGA